MNRTNILGAAGAMAFAALSSCGGDAHSRQEEDAPPGAEADTAALASTGGRRAFERAFLHTNARSCATCHALGEETTLRPASVEARLKADPRDPLFNRI